MPVYEYYCGDCRSPFEALRNMAAADAPLSCTNCGNTERVNRTISMVARVSSGAGSADAGFEGAASGGGGCCGGTCGCH